MAIVIITGASSGIGEAAARELAGRGHRLVLAARRVDRLESLAAELAALTEVFVVQADVAEPGSMDQLVERAVARFGAVDVLVNNAGVGHPEPWWSVTPDSIRHVVEVNLVAPMLGVRAVLPVMQKQGRGHIINIGSVAGHVGFVALYSATKFGLRGFTEALRREVRRFGIQVTLISPGFVRTEMTQKVRLKMPGADLVGRAIANVIERPRREVVVPGWYRFFISLGRHFPGLVDWATSRFGPADRRRRNE